MSKVFSLQLAEMVNLHFLSLIEALQECNSPVLYKLFPMWMPIFHSQQSHVSESLAIIVFHSITQFNAISSVAASWPRAGALADVSELGAEGGEQARLGSDRRRGLAALAQASSVQARSDRGAELGRHTVLHSLRQH